MAVIEQAERASTGSATVPIRVVDVDVHPIGLVEDIADYLDEPYRSRHYLHHRQEVEARDFVYPPNGTTSLRQDSFPRPGEGPPEAMDHILLKDSGVDYAILTPVTIPQRITDPDFDAAICRAENRLWADTWLSKYNPHGRYWGPIRVSPANPVAAGREIEHWAGHERLVQAYLHPDSPIPFGAEPYNPMFEAAARHELPVAIHPRKATGSAMLTPVGFVSYHIENFTQWPMQAMGHLASMVFEGLFDRFPTTRIVLLELGFTWLPTFMWRLDRRWEALRAELPHVKRRPSEYIREHVYFDTQPIEDIDPRQELGPVLDWVGADSRLMFATDYPHWDFDAPSWLEPRLPEKSRRSIMAGTAVELYNLPSERPVDAIDQLGDRRPAPEGPKRSDGRVHSMSSHYDAV